MAATTLRVSLTKLHQHIVDTQAFFEYRGEPVDNVVPVSISKADQEGLPKLKEALDKYREALNEFDCTFHDLYDCR